MIWPFTIAALLVANFVLLGVALWRLNKLSEIESLFSAAEKGNERVERSVRDEIARNREEGATAARELREEIAGGTRGLTDSFLSRIAEIAQLQQTQLESFAGQLAALTKTNAEKLEGMRNTVEGKLSALQQDSAQKLEQIRATVDEKLHATLEQRLGESFKLVSERLEQVHSGLGEMRTLATGVGDLKKVLTNIKTRGCWGEVQLGNLLEQMLTPDQFARNVATNPNSGERVEYAVKLPGRDDGGKPVWLPIDAKFPQEEYQRLVEAQERGDAEVADAAAAALEKGVRTEARKIAAKYIHPPDTTDFAILFLPTEGLFAEVLRRPGLCEGILQSERVVLSGPTTLAAVLSSLQMGFRTLAIAKQSSEVWSVLGAVKTEFSKFGLALEKVQKKLQEASNTVDDARRRSRVVQKRLQSAEEMPADKTGELLDPAELLLPALDDPASD